MIFADSLFLDVKEILLAHEYILDRVHRHECPHGRGSYGLVYVLGGRAEFRFFTGERIAVKDGNVLFLPPYAAYSIVTEKEFKHYAVNFNIHKNTSRLGILNKHYCLLEKENSEQLERKFKGVVNTWTAKKTGFEMDTMSRLYDLLSFFYFEYTNRQNNLPYQRLLPAKEHIERHFDQPITLEELAAISNMGVTNFRREWKKRYSAPPLQYRDSIRLHYAKEYLNSGYYTISEIAKKCGFDDVSYFVRFFKKQTGLTPGSYKKQTTGI